jgi:hypothetical protein
MSTTKEVHILTNLRMIVELCGDHCVDFVFLYLSDASGHPNLINAASLCSR